MNYTDRKEWPEQIYLCINYLYSMTNVDVAISAIWIFAMWWTNNIYDSRLAILVWNFECVIRSHIFNVEIRNKIFQPAVRWQNRLTIFYQCNNFKTLQYCSNKFKYDKLQLIFWILLKFFINKYQTFNSRSDSWGNWLPYINLNNFLRIRKEFITQRNW